MSTQVLRKFARYVISSMTALGYSYRVIITIHFDAFWSQWDRTTLYTSNIIFADRKGTCFGHGEKSQQVHLWPAHSLELTPPEFLPLGISEELPVPGQSQGPQRPDNSY